MEGSSALPNGDHREVIVVGASAGGMHALEELLGSLPSDLPASIFVVMHVVAPGPSVLASILERAGSLPARTAEDGEKIERGHVYVAPPDYHLLLGEGRVGLSGGPRVNGHRPAVDPLFRSAARLYGAQVVAVVLSGLLDDGSAGMRDVKDKGGATIVQDPGDAVHSDMPEAAIQAADPDHVLPVREMGPVLTRLLETPLPSGEVP
jgi:two-component system, chemotaxis family, protein-glutamate methylesterase/glutaminase